MIDFVSQIVSIFTDFWWGSAANYEAWLINAENWYYSHSLGWKWPLELIESYPYLMAFVSMCFVIVFFVAMLIIFILIGKAIANAGGNEWRRY